jgi:hypothetical protein
MWCEHCRCEVPVDFVPDGDEIRCGVCQALMPGALSDSASNRAEMRRLQLKDPPAAVADDSSESRETTGAGVALGPDPVHLAVDWELQRDLRQAKWLLQRSHQATLEASASVPEPRRPAVAQSAMRRSSTWGQRLCGAMLWLVVCLGAMGLAFGGALMGCTIGGQRRELWNWGLLTAMAGQFVVFLGVAGLLFLRIRGKSAPDVRPAVPAQVEGLCLPWSQRCNAALALRLDDLASSRGSNDERLR